MIDAGRHEDAISLLKNISTRELRPPPGIIKAADAYLLENTQNCPLPQFSAAFQLLIQWHVSDTIPAVFARTFHSSRLSGSTKKEKKTILRFRFSRYNFTNWDNEKREQIAISQPCYQLALRILRDTSCLHDSWDFASGEMITIFDSMWGWGTDTKKKPELAQTCMAAFKSDHSNIDAIGAIIHAIILKIFWFSTKNH